MQFLKQLTDPALKRLYKFVLKRLIGRFLAEDEIDLDQLDVHLRAGRLELCDLLLNADVLNSEVCEANGLPFRVKKGYLGSVRVTISYTNIMSESCLVEIDDIEIVLVPVSEAERTASGESHEKEKQNGNPSGSKNNAHTEKATSRSRSNSREHIDEVSQEGLDFVASWIDQVTSNIKVTLSNICLRLETGDVADGKNVALLCKLEWAQFTDESASEVASVYGRSGLGQSFGASQSMYQSMAASSLFGISQKAVKFRGISMDLLLPSDEIDEDDANCVLHHFLASDSMRQCYVQMKLSHYEALEAPAVDADLFLHSIRVVLQPQHFPHFGTLIDAFSEGDATKSMSTRAAPSSSMYASICDSRPQWLSDESEGANDESSGFNLSFNEFQRIEQLLRQYHQTHEELKRAQRERALGDGMNTDAYPVPRRLSVAESVESVGLSDLDDEDNFFDCETATDSVLGGNLAGSSNLMAQSMYASAIYAPEHHDVDGNHASSDSIGPFSRSSLNHRPARLVRSRVKVHLLECDIVVLYDDLPDHEEEDDYAHYAAESRRQRQLRRRRQGLPVITHQERIEVIVKDVIVSTLVYQTHTSASVSVGTFSIQEKMLARMSTDIEEDENCLLTNSVLRFSDTSPASGRKVNLSANLSAQVRVDLKPDGSTESLAVQVSAQPILFEWDMHILDRAHRLMKLMEESNAAKKQQAVKNPQSSASPPTYPKRLDANTECVEITLRFPLVNSDLIRFGPSAKRGLSEDKLTLLLDGVKVSSYENTPDYELHPSKKPQLPWMSQFDVAIDNIKVHLDGPRGGDQRSSVIDHFELVSGRSDLTSSDPCLIRIRLQDPTNAEIRSALTAKHNISQDSLEQYAELPAAVNSESEEKSGDDNDGGRVGSNGWSQDARDRASEFEDAASTASLMDLEIIIPHSKIIFEKRSFDRLMILFDALLMINPIDVNGHNQMMATAAYRNRLIPSYMSLNIALIDGTVQLNHIAQETTPPLPFRYHLAFQDLRVFQVSQWMGQLVSRLHVSAQNVSLLEENCKADVVVPVLYKNPIGVVEAPILFVGVDIVDQTQEMREMKVELHVSQVNLRYDVSSKWMFNLAELLLLEYPLPIIPLDSASTTAEEYLELLQQLEMKAYDAVKLAVPPKTVFTKLFASLYDAVIDYSPSTLTSRVMIILGNVSVSSNVVTGALIQGYKIAVRDMQLYLTPDRPSYEEIDSCILGNELYVNVSNTKKRAVVSFAGDTRSRAQLAGLYPSLLVFFEKHGFIQMITMDFIDIFLRAIVPPVEQPDALGSGFPEIKATPAALGSPELSVELNLGTANIYACFDSFNTLIELITVWTGQLSLEGEPRDTTAYVGLDRVKDVSSVSVVTNLGPATVRSSRPSFDEHTPQTSKYTRTTQRSIESASVTTGRDRMSGAASGHSVTGFSSINLFAQLDENAFGREQRTSPGTRATTDTEARLLRTRLGEIQKEKERIVNGATRTGQDDTLSATELRRKYIQDDEPKPPKVRINELVIEDYYSGINPPVQEHDAGAFLMTPEDPPQTRAAPWFAETSVPSHVGPAQDLSHPVGSLPEEHTARWLNPSAFHDTHTDMSVASSPRFDPIDGDGRSRAQDSPTNLNFLFDRDEAEEEDDVFPSAAYPAGPKNWWGTRSPNDVELSELQTEETASSFSHQLHFGDEDSYQDTESEIPPHMSMSMIGTGDDEGTEVELDFALDRDMQNQFNRLIDLESSDGQDGDADQDDIEDSEEKADLTQPPRSPVAANFDFSEPLSIPQRQVSSSNMSVHSEAASSAHNIISPPDEPTARWFYDDAMSDGTHREGPPSRIYPHHVEIPIGGAAASLSFGEKECEEAIRSVARESAARKVEATSPVLIRHVLLRDFNICMRFFGGSDWSRDTLNAPTLAHRSAAATSKDTLVTRPSSSSSKDRKEKLLDALLDDYVPSAGSDLFGNEDNSVLFTGAKSVPVTSLKNERSGTNSSRKRSLKSGRKTEEMLELVVTRIQLRLDMFNDEENQPLASNTVVALGDIEILDYISTSQIRKIICYWKSETSHPRESGSSMVHVHLMTVRPGPNLCEEHRLKMRILPLRVNLDQEVVNFLRQFVPTDDLSRVSRSASAPFDHDESDVPDFDGTELSSLNPLTPSRVTETDVDLGSWFFQSIEVRPCKIKIDYRPNRVDFQALRAGDYLEVINLFVLEGMELVLRRVKASGIDGWSALGEHVLMSWVNDISRHQIHKCVASVSMPPLRSFANIGSGAADLILLPLEHYGKDRRVVRGIKKGAKSFLKSVTIETLNTASKFAQGTQALLEHADDVVSSSSSRKKQIKYRQPGSRIARNSKRMGGGGIRSAQDRGGIGSRQYLAQQPSNATEGLYQAYDSLSRELHVAAKTIVAVPLVEYKKTGSQGYVRSVIRAVPVAVLRPMIGATEAVSKALIGVRNAVDPELKEDVENKFKDFRTI